MLLPLLTALLAPRPAVTFDSLLAEMTNPAVLAEL